MARPFYPHEVDDPDLDWLVSNFLFERPDYIPVEAGFLPLVLIPFIDEESKSNSEEESYIVCNMEDPSLENAETETNLD